MIDRVEVIVEFARTPDDWKRLKDIAASSCYLWFVAEDGSLRGWVLETTKEEDQG